MFVVFVAIFGVFGQIGAVDLGVNAGRVVLTTFDSNPLIKTSILCGGPPNLANSSKTPEYTFFYNADQKLPSNVVSKMNPDKTYSLYFTYPKASNNGNYTCCLNTSSTVSTCYTTTVVVNENFHYDLSGVSTVAVSQQRDNYFSLFNNVTLNSFSCKANGNETLPTNVLVIPLNLTDLPYPSSYSQVVIQNMAAEDFGEYSCVGLDSNTQVVLKNFTLTEAANRTYPWDENLGDCNGAEARAFWPITLIGVVLAGVLAI